jgi:uncharacterized protein YraI
MVKLKLVLLVGAALALSLERTAADPALAVSDLNIRSGPGAQYPVAGRIPGGSTVEASNCGGSWCTVRWGGRSGYVNQSFLDFGGDVPPGVAIPVAPPGSYPSSRYYPPPADYVPPPPVYREPSPYGYPPPDDAPPYYGPGPGGPAYRDAPAAPRGYPRAPNGQRSHGAPQRQQQRTQPAQQQQSAPAKQEPGQPPQQRQRPASPPQGQAQPPRSAPPPASPPPAAAPPPAQGQTKSSAPPAAPAKQPDQPAAATPQNAPADKK